MRLLLSSLTTAAVLLCLILPLVAPLTAVVPATVTDLLGSARRAGLLLDGIVWSGTVALAAGSIALTLALGCPPRAVRRWLFLALLTALIPPYLHALAWLALAGRLNQLTGLSLLPVSGWGSSVWVGLLAYLPYAVACAFAGVVTVPSALLDAARLHGTEAAVARRIALPLALPGVLAGMLAVFLLSLIDFSVSSAFSVNVYALELFADFSATGDAGRMAVLALPLLAVTVPAGVLALRFALAAGGVAAWTGTYPTLRASGCWRLARQGAAALLVTAVVVPVAALAWQAGSPAAVISAATAAAAELRVSLVVAAVTAVAAVGFALLVAAGRRRARCWWLLPALVAPAPLVGVGLITLWNTLLPCGLYGTLAMPMLAGFARFAPWAVLLLVLHRAALDGNLLDAARLVPRSPLTVWLRLRLPLLRPGVLAAAAAVFALTLGELGATMLVVPPGAATVTMRIYDYLHYGAAEMVAGLALTVLAAAGLSSVLLMRGLTGWRA